MKKAILLTITALAVITIFVVGAAQELTAGAIIAVGIACGWLALLAVANSRRKHRDH